MKVVCPKDFCGYEWDCVSRMIRVTCPSCHLNFKVREKLVEKKQ